MGGYEDAPDIYMIKAHLHPDAVDPQGRSRKLYIVRDVRDTVVSLAHYTSWRHKKPFAAELQRIVDNTRWQSFYHAWMLATDIFVRYEELREEPGRMVQEVIEALDVPVAFTERTLPRFRGLQKAMPRFFRRGVVGGWRDVLSEAQEAQLWDQFGERMNELGYTR